MSECDIPIEFRNCIDIYLEQVVRNKSLEDLIDQLRKLLQLEEGQSIVEAVEKLLSNKEEVVEEKEPDITVLFNKQTIERAKICQKLIELGVPYNSKDSTKRLERVLKKSAKPVVKIPKFEW